MIEFRSEFGKLLVKTTSNRQVLDRVVAKSADHTTYFNDTLNLKLESNCQ